MASHLPPRGEAPARSCGLALLRSIMQRDSLIAHLDTSGSDDEEAADEAMTERKAATGDVSLPPQAARFWRRHAEPFLNGSRRKLQAFAAQPTVAPIAGLFLFCIFLRRRRVRVTKARSSPSVRATSTARCCC